MKYDVEDLMKSQGSISAWIRELDLSFSNLVRKTSYGTFDRLGWQLLHYLHQNPLSNLRELKKYLTFFDKPEKVRKMLDHFEKEGFVLIEGSSHFLTEKGKAAYQETLMVQRRILEKAFEGIEATEYITTIHVLRTLTENILPYCRKYSS